MADKVDDVFQEPGDLLAGKPHGNVFPKPQGSTPVTLPPVDARTRAIDRFRLFVSRLRFTRLADDGKTLVPYNIPIDDVLGEQPGDSKRLNMPSVSVLPALGTNNFANLGPLEPIEETRDKYGSGTVLLDGGTYEEQLTVEVWGSSRAQRWSVVAGLTTAMSSLSTSNAMRLTLPDYFDQVASFMLVGSQYVDDPDVVRNRRRALVFVQLLVPNVALARYVPFRPSIQSTMVLSSEQLAAFPARVTREP